MAYTFGYTGERSLKVLSQMNMFCGYVVDKLITCRCHDLGKWWKIQFNTTIREFMKIAELISLNVCRLSTRFMLTVVDDYSKGLGLLC